MSAPVAVNFVPPGTFAGRNFMTPEAIGFYRLPLPGRRYAYAEISRGRGMRNQVIYGLTVRLAGGARLWPDPSQMCQSEAEALDILERLP